MQNDKIYSDIVSTLARSRTEANGLLEEIEELERSLYKIGDGDFNSTMEHKIRAKTAYAIDQSIGETDREVFLKDLKAKINSLTYLGLKIAFEPNLEIVGKLHTWVKQNLGEGVALDIVIDKSILGGAIIEYKGKIGNFSILKEVDHYFV